MLDLPKEFLSRMENMLGDGYDGFIKSYAKESLRSLRINTLKTDGEAVKKSVFFNAGRLA